MLNQSNQNSRYSCLKRGAGNCDDFKQHRVQGYGSSERILKLLNVNTHFFFVQIDHHLEKPQMTLERLTCDVQKAEVKHLQRKTL